MITDAQAKLQVARLAGLRYFPDQIPAIQELVLALQEAAKNEAHAKKIVTEWIRDNENCPTPSHFYRLVQSSPNEVNAPKEFLR